MPERTRTARWLPRLAQFGARLHSPLELAVEGKLTRMVGLTLEAAGCEAAIGDRCVVMNRAGEPLMTEVVGFAGERVFLMPTGSIRGLAPNARVIPLPGAGDIAVGDAMLGRVIDGAGRPLDGKGPLRLEERQPLQGVPINPLTRAPIRTPLDVGVRSINALLTVGRGQRIGLFAPSGVGKSVLLGMMTRYTNADVIVVGLVGERGREVQEFIDDSLGPAGLARAVVVATPADVPPLMRMHGAALATCIAEYFRDQGRHVLLLMDSLTRYAQAYREIALTIGEPPATRGYPPSVFARLPQLVERAGNGAQGRGSITAFYTVLTEGTDGDDPIAENARAILDGHFVLSRSLAERGQYPALDVEASISRTMTQVISGDHLELAKTFRHYYSLYDQNQDLLSVGAYQPGHNTELDRAIEIRSKLQSFLRQEPNQAVNLDAALAMLQLVLK